MIDFHLRRFGPTGGRPVLCLHGFLGTGADFADLAAAVDNTVLVLAPDLPRPDER